MDKSIRHIASLLASLVLVLGTGATALADDTELFVAGEDTTGVNSDARPNILFIIDTSGSMDGKVYSQVDWDPDETFSGCYDTNTIYWSYTSNAPGCGTDRYFRKGYNLCKAAQTQLAGLGAYEGDLLAWRARNNASRSRWVELSTNRNRYVECRDDRGKHGWSDGEFYAADGTNGPLATSDRWEPSWVYHYYLFDGNYLNWLNGGNTISRTRLDIVQQVTNNLLDNLTDVNVGLMRFNNDDGGPVIHAMEYIEDARDEMKDKIDALDANGWTPLSETLYEAHQYYSGGKVVYGSGYNYQSVGASRIGGTTSSGTYKSPITFGCQKNYIILLSDGEPTQDRGAQSRIESLPGFTTYTGQQSCQAGEPYTGGSSNPDDGICLDELAQYMRQRDMSTDFFGPQNITTYTIGFTVDLDLLKTTAQKGGGKYYLANDTSSLADALTKIAVSILDDASTFAAPSVPVNSFNRTQSLNDFYVSVFNPSSTVHWPGNMKKYRLVGGKVLDANGQPAVDPNTGYFSDAAQSFWSVEPDGDRVPEGGAAQNLPEFTSRNLYSNLISNDLNSPGNLITATNTNLTAGLLGVPADQVEMVRAWMAGLDAADANDNGEITDTRRQMGDPLHVRPAPVVYGGSAASPDITLYTATNDGFVHAVNPETGRELWSWVPRRLLPMMYTKFLDETSSQRLYGLDGEIGVHIYNDDGLGGISDNERVILVFGMRRGGNAYFALDVTDRNDPQLLWEIDANTPGFEDIGQTWSTPQFGKVKIGTTIREVAFVGGGYDPGQDADDYRIDQQGNAIYMIDVLTGQKIWSAGQTQDHNLVLADMEHSIPAPLRVIDLNGNGLSDRIYVGDMGGRLWRFDLFHGNSAGEIGQGGMIAQLGAAGLSSPTAADLRRFYNQVDAVAYSQDGKQFLILNVGSGYRAHPLDRDIEEEFFSVRDFVPFARKTADQYGEPIVRDQLTDITSLPSARLDKDDAGWRLRLIQSSGEKVLSRSLTFKGTIYFTSFAPGSAANACTASAGINRFYQIDLLTGDPVVNLDESEDQEELTETDRSKLLRQGSIAPQVEILFTADNPDQPSWIIGPETGQLGDPDRPIQSYWTQMGAE